MQRRADLEMTRDFLILFQNGVGLTVITVEPTPFFQNWCRFSENRHY
jgi:hypothetical protein